MKIGLSGIKPLKSSWSEFKEIATLADKLGYSCISIGESWGEDAFTGLSQVAAVTSTIKVGTGIVPTFGRSPANLSMAALSLDSISDGRFFLGLGSSGKIVIEDFHGEEYSKPLTRMREYIEFIKLAAQSERLNMNGEFVKTQRFKIKFKPYRNTLPIYIASLTPKSLELTGEIADGWLPIFFALDRMDKSFESLTKGLQRSNRTIENITISAQVATYVTNDIESAFDAERKHMAFYIGGMGTFYHQYMHRIGFGNQADKIRTAYINKNREQAAQLVTDEMVSSTSIIGSPESCANQMEKFFSNGVDEIRLVLNNVADSNSFKDNLTQLAPYIKGK
jgi:F420-dependent oxidoreductase-like protein